MGKVVSFKFGIPQVKNVLEILFLLIIEEPKE
jgi:hypothetical protein